MLRHNRALLIAEAATGGVKKESVAQMFSCQFCEIFKNAIFTEHIRVTTSAIVLFNLFPE